jgi:hypothetical protein
MKHLLVHYRNKYPGGHVDMRDDSLDVYDAEGEHRVALRKDGSGSLRDASRELGALDQHDLSPLPKDARLYKIKDGVLAKDELYEERKKGLSAFLKDGKVMSCEEMGLEKFDDRQKLK